MINFGSTGLIGPSDCRSDSLALNPLLGSHAMPVGWWHGRLGAIATLDGISAEVESRLLKLLGGDTKRFVVWVGERTQALIHAYDRERGACWTTILGLFTLSEVQVYNGGTLRHGYHNRFKSPGQRFNYARTTSVLEI
jgi:hypothetical protein